MSIFWVFSLTCDFFINFLVFYLFFGHFPFFDLSSPNVASGQRQNRIRKKRCLRQRFFRAPVGQLPLAPPLDEPLGLHAVPRGAALNDPLAKNISRFVIHPDFNPNTWDHDFCLLEPSKVSELVLTVIIASINR